MTSIITTLTTRNGYTNSESVKSIATFINLIQEAQTSKSIAEQLDWTRRWIEWLHKAAINKPSHSDLALGGGTSLMLFCLQRHAPEWSTRRWEDLDAYNDDGKEEGITQLQVAKAFERYLLREQVPY
jgi:hypothetical protein